MLHREKATDGHKPHSENLGPFHRLSAKLRRQLAMPSAHQSSTFRLVFGRISFHIRRHFKLFARRVLDWLKPTRSADLRLRFSRFNQHVEKRKWHDALREALEIGRLAESNHDAQLMKNMSKALEKLRQYPEAARLRLSAISLLRGNEAKEWSGSDVSDQTLLIDFWRQSAKDAKQALGPALRRARLIAPAAARTKRCIVLAEPRLVPIFRRSFPGVDIHPGGFADDAAFAEADIVATGDHLAAILAADEAAIIASFSPLLASSTVTEELRTKYRGGDEKPLIGLSWGSKTYLKEMPSLTDWADLLRGIDAKFISLQYGNIESDLRKLEDGGVHVLHDTSVDQLVDMDRFAAQIAALDAVISISNTAAHLTGALGVPAVFVLDDNFTRGWPVIGETSPWYPSAQLVRKEGRSWNETMQEVRTRVRTLLESTSGN